jgi:predicted RNA polymerase sigma factor
MKVRHTASGRVARRTWSIEKRLGRRAIALGKAVGLEEGLAELSRIPDIERLKEYPFYPAALGEFHLVAGRHADALKHFEMARALARSPTEASFLGPS